MYSDYMLRKNLQIDHLYYETSDFNVSNFYFNSIGDIIDHYRKEQIVEGYYLKEPVPMQVSVVFLQ